MKKILLLSLLLIQPVYAEYITNDIVSGCDGGYFYRAQFVKKQIICPNGYYLPANALSCELCPNGYACNGGTYSFNENNFSGAEYTTNITNNMNNICASNAPVVLRAVFRPHTITINWDDGTNITQNTCQYGGAITLPPTPVRPGYVFGGWRIKNPD